MTWRDHLRLVALIVINAVLQLAIFGKVSDAAWNDGLTLAAMYVIVCAVREQRKEPA